MNYVGTCLWHLLRWGTQREISPDCAVPLNSTELYWLMVTPAWKEPWFMLLATPLIFLQGNIYVGQRSKGSFTLLVWLSRPASLLFEFALTVDFGVTRELFLRKKVNKKQLYSNLSYIESQTDKATNKFVNIVKYWEAKQPDTSFRSKKETAEKSEAFINLGT